jgi:hypothetical protein
METRGGAKGSLRASLAEFCSFIQLSVSNMATFGCVCLRYWLPSTHLIATDYHLFVPSSLSIGGKRKKVVAFVPYSSASDDVYE